MDLKLMPSALMVPELEGLVHGTAEEGQEVRRREKGTAQLKTNFRSNNTCFRAHRYTFEDFSANNTKTLKNLF